MSWYTANPTYDTILAAGLAFAAFVAVISVFTPSPYGRFSSSRWGVSLSPRLGWFLMELPATISFVVVFFAGTHWSNPVPLFFLGLWLVHYGNRGFAFPFLIRTPKGATSSFSLMVVATGWAVTSVHGYLNAAMFSELGGHYTTAWFADPRFVIGLAIYVVSLVFNIRADAVIRNLRTAEELAAGEKVYRIPRGGLFERVTNANYLTELTAWAGFALCTWSLGAVFVLAISLANLVPRAVATHRWYHARFADYPKGRKVLVPFIF